MKCTVVFSNPSCPDVVYLSADEEFTRILNNTSFKNGRISKEAANATEIDLNEVTSYFQSMLASYDFMSTQFHSPYNSFECEDGTIVVIKQFGENVLIMINGDRSESEDFMLHKIWVLNRILAFLFGIISDGLIVTNRDDKSEIWDTITRLMSSWCRLYRSEQSFMLEAVERLQVNQMLNGLCISLLESMGNKRPVHSMLLVKGKLLTLFSSPNAPELISSDILLITLIVESIYPSPQGILQQDNVKTREFPRGDRITKVGSSQFYMGTDEYSNEDEDDNKSDGSSYHTIGGNSPEFSDAEENPYRAPSPKLSVVITSGNTSDSANEGATHEDNAEEFSTPKGTTPVARRRSTNMTSSKSDERVKPENIPASASAALSTSNLFQNYQPSLIKGRSFPNEGVRLDIFLQQLHCNYVPHSLSLVPILPGITLVVLTERQVQLAKTIIDALSLVGNANKEIAEILKKGSRHNTIQRLDDLIQRQIAGFFKMDYQPLSEIQKALKSLKEKCSLKEKINSSGERSDEKHRLVKGGLELLSSRLKTLFKYRYGRQGHIVKNFKDEQAADYLHSQNALRKHLEAYHEYLCVKAERNITMTTYLDNFPGLVHFLHVNRKTNQLTTPSINCGCDSERQGAAGLVLQRMIWRFVEKVRKMIQMEYTTISYKEGDFQLSYFLYFENEVGKILPMPGLSKMPKDGYYPGLQAEKYFRFITEKSFQTNSPDLIRCCELFCIHLAILPAADIAEQATKLKECLWESSGDAATPINLL